MDLLRQKSEQWRNRYRPVAESIARLEAEIPKLEAEDARTMNRTVSPEEMKSEDPNVRTGGERTRERLAAARRELAEARRELAEIEEGARRDGVPSGQLY